MIRAKYELISRSGGVVAEGAQIKRRSLRIANNANHFGICDIAKK